MVVDRVGAKISARKFTPGLESQNRVLIGNGIEEHIQVPVLSSMSLSPLSNNDLTILGNSNKIYGSWRLAHMRRDQNGAGMDQKISFPELPLDNYQVCGNSRRRADTDSARKSADFAYEEFVCPSNR